MLGIRSIEVLKKERNLTLLFIHPFLRLGRLSSIRHNGYGDGLKTLLVRSRPAVRLAEFLGL